MDTCRLVRWTLQVRDVDERGERGFQSYTSVPPPPLTRFPTLKAPKVHTLTSVISHLVATKVHVMWRSYVALNVNAWWKSVGVAYDIVTPTQNFVISHFVVTEVHVMFKEAIEVHVILGSYAVF